MKNNKREFIFKSIIFEKLFEMMLTNGLMCIPLVVIVVGAADGMLHG